MRLFPIIDQAMLSQESRTAYYSKTPRCWPSEASAELFDKREAAIIGGCHRKSYFRLTGEPLSNQIDVVGARRFRTGRAMELDIVTLAKEAGIFVACGVRYHVTDVDLPLELDLVVIDPDTKRLCIVENKTIYGYVSNKKVIKEGHPKLEGVMQSAIYLNEFSTGEVLKEIIVASYERKRELAAQMESLNPESWEHKAARREHDRNRIEVDFDNLEAGDNGPVLVKMTYETRDDCQTREFDIGLHEDEIDGLHYPEIDGIPQKVFAVESIYERYPNGTTWSRDQALERNGTICWLSRAVIVAEAQKISGTMNTVRQCLKIGRPLYAVCYDNMDDFAQGNQEAIRLGGRPLFKSRLNSQAKLGPLLEAVNMAAGAFAKLAQAALRSKHRE